MECPHCGNIIEKDVRFCPFCAFPVEKDIKKGLKKNIIAIGLFLIVLFIGELLYNFCYEQKMGKPFSCSIQKEDINVTVHGSYDKKYKTVHINILTDEIIEPWQIEFIGNHKVVLNIWLNTNKGVKEIGYDTVTFVPHKALSANYTIQNMSFKGYQDIKKTISETTAEKNNFKLRHSNIISFDNSSRKALKKEYLNWKEEQRQLRLRQEMQRAQARQMLYNYYTYGMYY